jgi:hypothetical protein
MAVHTDMLIAFLLNLSCTRRGMVCSTICQCALARQHILCSTPPDCSHRSPQADAPKARLNCRHQIAHLSASDQQSLQTDDDTLPNNNGSVDSKQESTEKSGVHLLTGMLRWMFCVLMPNVAMGQQQCSTATLMCRLYGVSQSPRNVLAISAQGLLHVAVPAVAVPALSPAPHCMPFAAPRSASMASTRCSTSVNVGRSLGLVAMHCRARSCSGGDSLVNSCSSSPGRNAQPYVSCLSAKPYHTDKRLHHPSSNCDCTLNQCEHMPSSAPRSLVARPVGIRAAYCG